MAVLPKLNNQVVITIISDLLIAIIIIASLISSQGLQRKFSTSLIGGATQQESEIDSLFNKFLIINLFTILVSSGTLMYLVIKNAKKLEETNEKLKSIDKLKDEFLSIASHQLKTPASGVKAFLSMLLNGDAGKLNEDQKKFVNEAYDANEREGRIIEDLLNVSRIETGRLVLNKIKVELNELVESCANELDKEMKDADLQFTLQKSPEKLNVEGDEDKMKMVFGNLIDNARKYTDKGGKIAVSVEKTDNNARVTISDTGIGMAKEDVARLFQKYFRIDSRRSRMIGGTGLGLYIADKIVKLHGGKIEVQSEVGKGTKFIIILPLSYDKGSYFLRKEH